MKKSKLILSVIVLFGLGIVGWFALQEHKNNQINPIADYQDLLAQGESGGIDVQESVNKVALTTMLESGINTLGGILQSVPESDQSQIINYQIYLNGQPTKIKAVSEIELVKAFLLNGKQVLLFSFDQGGNQCARQYQFISISESSNKLSSIFGTCLPISKLSTESNETILIATPQNNPYLGDDVNYIYKYQNDEVKLISKPNKTSIKSKYASMTAGQIIQKATADGCYQDGVLLDDGACGGGRRYCTMFKALRNPVKDSNYQVLKDFCN